MNDLRASRLSFLKRHYVTASPSPILRAIEGRMTYPADSFDSNCRIVSEFIATMNRPLSPNTLRDFEEVWDLMRYYDDCHPVRTLLSPNGRVLTAWHKVERNDKREVDRSLIIKVANIRQLELISSKINRLAGHPSVDGNVTFWSRVRRGNSGRPPWFHNACGQVCRMHCSRFVERGDIVMTYEIYIIAPNVER